MAVPKPDAIIQNGLMKIGWDVLSTSEAPRPTALQTPGDEFNFLVDIDARCFAVALIKRATANDLDGPGVATIRVPPG
jgi:hypothetical protein